eukprot:6212008-Pleurochrysis_carterae.AAC.2
MSAASDVYKRQLRGRILEERVQWAHTKTDVLRLEGRRGVYSSVVRLEEGCEQRVLQELKQRLGLRRKWEGAWEAERMGEWEAERVGGQSKYRDRRRRQRCMGSESDMGERRERENRESRRKATDR